MHSLSAIVRSRFLHFPSFSSSYRETSVHEYLVWLVECFRVLVQSGYPCPSTFSPVPTVFRIDRNLSSVSPPPVLEHSLLIPVTFIIRSHSFLLLVRHTISPSGILHTIELLPPIPSHPKSTPYHLLFHNQSTQRLSIFLAILFLQFYCTTVLFIPPTPRIVCCLHIVATTKVLSVSVSRSSIDRYPRSCHIVSMLSVGNSGMCPVSLLHRIRWSFVLSYTRRWILVWQLRSWFFVSLNFGRVSRLRCESEYLLFLTTLSL